MDFILWACRVMHVVSVVVWLGGLIFINAVLIPIVEYEKETRAPIVQSALRRFQPFVWFSLWTLPFTGFLLMLLSPRFLWFDVSTLWSQLLSVKVAAFVLLAFFGWQQGKVLRALTKSATAEEDVFEGWRRSYNRLVRRSIAVSLVALLAAGAMMVV